MFDPKRTVPWMTSLLLNNSEVVSEATNGHSFPSMEIETSEGWSSSIKISCLMVCGSIPPGGSRVDHFSCVVVLAEPLSTSPFSDVLAILQCNNARSSHDTVIFKMSSTSAYQKRIKNHNFSNNKQWKFGPRSYLLKFVKTISIHLKKQFDKRLKKSS